MATVQQHISIARSLPPQLLHFFKRFPPPQLSSSQPKIETIQIAENTSSSDANASTPSIGVESSSDTSTTSSLLRWKTNPFLPFKNPTTGSWHGPHYSLRRQSSLFKLAAAHHVLPLLPPSPKHPAIKLQKRLEHGLRVKGTGEGQRVKGKYWERTLKQRLGVRQKAMEAMPDMITLWKERGHGRGWKKFPKGKGKAGDQDEVFRGDMRHAWVRERAPGGQ